jgi:hypothetical protein
VIGKTYERERGREPDPRSWEAVAVSQRYARGEATADELVAAWSAAELAAAESAVAKSAMWSASESAAAELAAWSAAAERSAANAMLLSLLPRELIEGRASP